MSHVHISKRAARADFSIHVLDSFRRQKIMQFYHAKITKLERGLVEISMPNRTVFQQQDSFVHAGALLTVADSAGGYATLSLLPSGSRVLSVEIKMNFLRPATGTIIRGRGHVKKLGQTISVAEIETEMKQGRNWVGCAWGVQTIYCIRTHHIQDVAELLL